jgi:hypothetical protein
MPLDLSVTVRSVGPECGSSSGNNFTRLPLDRLPGAWRHRFSVWPESAVLFGQRH